MYFGKKAEENWNWELGTMKKRSRGLYLQERFERDRVDALILRLHPAFARFLEIARIKFGILQTAFFIKIFIYFI